MRACWRFLTAAYCCSLLLACSGEPTELDQSSDTTASLRLVNAVMTGPTLKFLIDGEQVVSGLAFPEATGYLTAPAECVIEVRHSVTNTTMLTRTLRLTADVGHTLLITGDASTLVALVVTDANGMPTAGTAELRVIHVAPEADPFDLYLSEPGTGESPWMEPLDYLAVTSYRAGQPGTYVITTRRVGSRERMRQHTLELLAGRVRTVVVVDGTNHYMEFVDLLDFL